MCVNINDMQTLPNNQTLAAPVKNPENTNDLPLEAASNGIVLLDYSKSFEEDGVEVAVNFNQDGSVEVMYSALNDLGSKSNHYVQTKVDEMEWQKFLLVEKKSLVFKVDLSDLKPLS